MNKKNKKMIEVDKIIYDMFLTKDVNELIEFNKKLTDLVGHHPTGRIKDCIQESSIGIKYHAITHKYLLE